jgi:ABC-type lipoprotein release transport system permease subunit
VKGGNYRKLYTSDDLDRALRRVRLASMRGGFDLAVEDIDASYVFVNIKGGKRFAPMRPETIYKLIAR